MANLGVLMMDEADTYSWYRFKQLSADNSEKIFKGVSS
jgi:hypothetical protein